MSNKKKKKIQRRVQTCSYCGKTGHNRRKCPFLVFNENSNNDVVVADTFIEFEQDNNNNDDNNDSITEEDLEFNLLPKTINFANLNNNQQQNSTATLTKVKQNLIKDNSNIKTDIFVFNRTKHKYQVRMNFFSATKKSPYVLDLREKILPKIETIDWQEIIPYQEKSQTVKREKIDFAKLIRESLDKQKKKKIQNSNRLVVESIKNNLSKIDLQIKSENNLNKKVFSIKPIKQNDFKFSFKPENVNDKKQKIEIKYEDSQDNFKFLTSLLTKLTIFFKKIFKKINFLKFKLIIWLLIFGLVIPWPVFSYYQNVKKTTNNLIIKGVDGFSSLQNSAILAFKTDISGAKTELNQALNLFAEAEDILNNQFKVLLTASQFIPILGAKIKSRESLLLAGHNLALANSYFVKGLDEVINSTDIDIPERINVLYAHLYSAWPLYKQAQDNLLKVRLEDLPHEYQSSYQDFLKIYNVFISDYDNVLDVLEMLKIILGEDSLKRYLVVFQNSHEIRATGGFLGSMAIVDIQKGKIIDLKVPGGGTYDLQGQLVQNIIPPTPILLVNKRWEFQDSNWFADFRKSAQKMEWFYQQSRNRTIDGVIAVNSNVLTRILKVLGPIYDSETGILLNSDNALERIQHYVEVGYEDIKQPKKILSSILEQILNSLQFIKPKQLLTMVVQVNQALDQKEIQMYFNDSQVQSKIEEFGWSGQILKNKVNQDYLMVVNSNIGGAKTDKYIKQEIEHQIIIKDNGQIEDTVFITRHYKKHNKKQSYYQSANIDYIRVYTPLGSKLISAGGFIMPDEDMYRLKAKNSVIDNDLAEIVKNEIIDSETGTFINQESDKTVFANWLILKPGETKTVYFKYLLPFNIFNNKTIKTNLLTKLWQDLVKDENKLSKYNLIIQKQSGVNSKLKIKVIYPETWRPIWTNDLRAELNLNGLFLNRQLDEDIILGLIMNKIN